MTDTKEFKVALIRNGITAGELADKVNLSRQSLSYKMNNIREFTSSEIAKICEVLDLDIAEKERIFFGNTVDN